MIKINIEATGIKTAQEAVTRLHTWTVIKPGTLLKIINEQKIMSAPGFEITIEEESNVIPGRVARLSQHGIYVVIDKHGNLYYSSIRSDGSQDTYELPTGQEVVNWYEFTDPTEEVLDDINKALGSTFITKDFQCI